MATIAVQLDEAQTEVLREKAERYGLRPEQLVRAAIENLIGQPEPQFAEAARRILVKNRELYRRLS